MEKRSLEKNLSEEEDPSGARGIARANFILRKGDIKKDFHSAILSKKSIKDIIKYTPKEIGVAPNADSKIIKYFREFKNEGYRIDKPYMKMDKVGRWNYFLSFLRENDYFKQE